MEPKIEILSEKKLVGKSLQLSFENYRVHELWRAFMPRRREILNSLANELISMAIYSPSFDFKDIDPKVEFQRWAAVEVASFDQIPDGFETYTLTSGLYAIFHYKGLSTDISIFKYIFNSWLPNSPYILDSRPHLEILGAKYKNDDPNSEEDICIPIKNKV